MRVNGTKYFDRENLKKVFFGQGDNGDWYLKTVRICRDSLRITIVKSCISDDTMRLIVPQYVDEVLNGVEFVDPLAR